MDTKQHNYAFTPREYQERQSDVACERIKSPSKRKSLLVAPTASGKSWTIAMTAYKLNSPSLVLQPDYRLLQQNVEKFKLATGYTPGIFSASAGIKRMDDITYATLGSLLNHVNDFTELVKGRNLIIDESHLYSHRKKSESKAASVFMKFVELAQIKNVAAFTATPFLLRFMGSRYDSYSKLSMMNRIRGGYFNDIVDVVPISAMLEGKWWTPIKYVAIPYKRELLKTNSNGSDFTPESNKNAFISNGIMAQCIKHVNQAIEKGRKKMLVFMPSVKLAQEFASKVSGFVAVWGDMPDRDYEIAMKGYNNGLYRGIVNVDMFTTGFDDPQIDAIFVCRAMLSLALWYQIVGRGTRIDPSGNKKDCVVVDYCGNIDRFGCVEDLEILDVQGYGWGVFGSGGRLLTDLRMDGSEVRHDKQPWTKQNVHQLSGYRAAMYKNLTA